MSLPISTRTFIAAEQYMNNFLTLNEEGFVNSLTADAQAIHGRCCII